MSICPSILTLIRHLFIQLQAARIIAVLLQYVWPMMLCSPVESTIRISPHIQHQRENNDEYIGDELLLPDIKSLSSLNDQVIMIKELSWIFCP